MMNHTVKIHLFYECRGKHSHNYGQILVPLQKTMTINIEGAEYSVTSQELCFIPEDMTHECDFYGKMLALDMTGTSGVRDSALAHPVILPMKGQIVQLVELIQTELKQNPESKSVHFLYDYLYGKLMEHGAPPSVRYISEHYDLPITVNELAEIESYNVTYYNGWFKQRTGVSPATYVRKTRIEKAKELIQSTDYSMTDVAAMVGYSSNSTFTRAFRSITGMTPSEFKERSSGAVHKENQLERYGGV